jgi:glucans biosynthesis protein
MFSVTSRRSFLTTIALGAAGAVLPLEATMARDGLKFGPAAPFSFDRLRALARRKAAAPYLPSRPVEGASAIDYDAWGKIKFDSDKALFAAGPLPVTFFHLGKYFQKPMAVFAVHAGAAREVIYDPAYFHMPADSPARRLPPGSGFAGFRVQEPRAGRLDWRRNDWVAFLGASYFRAIGELHQYGLSARGIAIDTAVDGQPEEFPDFTQVYIEQPAPGASTIVVNALLDGPSVVGACRFSMTRGKGVVMDVEQTLFVRRRATRFGIAPLTSMYWFSETAKPTAVDWRPEVHDSDGLAIWNGQGERLWRPLNDPSTTAVSAFRDENPKGFGLMQRDRNFDHYQDGVFYDRRPSLWVEPKGNWGRGSVQLLELPTNDEVNDNIVAAWVPEAPPAAGAELNIGYRLSWLADEPHPSGLARCVATRLGRGGQPGQPRPADVRKFVVEFLGGPLARLPFGVTPQLDLWVSRGTVTPYRIIEAVPDGVPGHWRAEFDLAGVQGAEPVEMRLALRVGGKTVSETWTYQYRGV